MLTSISILLFLLSILAAKNGVFGLFVKKIFSIKMAKQNYNHKKRLWYIIRSYKGYLLIKIALKRLKEKPAT